MKRFIIAKSAIACLLFFSLLGCKEDQPQTITEDQPQQTIPRFSQDSAYAFVAKQVSFGPRVPNTEAHRLCKEWLVSKLKEFDAKVIEQDFTPTAYTGEKLNATNIIGQFNAKSRRRILLAAHWDSRHIADSPLSKERRNEPILGADDGASGVGVLLEIARNLQENPIGLGLDIIFFDAEDYGDNRDKKTQAEQIAASQTWALGSQYWARNPHVSGYRPMYGILLDMVGSKNARFPKEGYSMQFAPQVVEKVWTLAQRMGRGDFFVNENVPGITDDHLFVNRIAGIPMIDIINLPAHSGDLTFGEYWHTHDDDMDVIDKRTLGAVGQVVMAVIYRESYGTL